MGVAGRVAEAGRFVRVSALTKGMTTMATGQPAVGGFQLASSVMHTLQTNADNSEVEAEVKMEEWRTSRDWEMQEMSTDTNSPDTPT